jgi:hypothetical protein
MMLGLALLAASYDSIEPIKREKHIISDDNESNVTIVKKRRTYRKNQSVERQYYSIAY